MNVQPDTLFEAVIDTGETGLVGTIGVCVNDNTGTLAVAFTTSGIAELADGVYAATGLTSPDTQGQYTLIWQRGAAGEVLGIEDLTVTGSAPGDPVPPAAMYGTVAEFLRRVNITGANVTADKITAAERDLVAASGEANAWMARETDLAAWEVALVTEIVYERAAELWVESQKPFGVISVDNPTGPVFASRHSRALHKLGTVRQRFGVS